MRLLGAIAALLLAVSCASSAPARPTETPPAGLPVIDLSYPGGTLRVEVASTAEQRAAGLSNRDTLAADAGMLFDLQQTRRASFWMKDTRIPLDMVWIREDRTVSSVTAAVQPEPGVADADLRMYPSQEPVRYVLELNGGAAARLGITPGDVLEFDLP